MRRILFCFLIAVTLCSVRGLSSAGEPSKEGPSKVVAEVNGVPITLGEVEEEVTRIIARTSYHRDAPPEKREALKKEAIEKLIEKELAYQDGKRQGIKVEKEKVEERLNVLKKRFPSEKAFEEALLKNSLTPKKLEELVEKQLVIEKVFRVEVDEKAKVGDAEIRDSYEKNKDKFREPEKIKLRHIAVMFDPSKGNEDKERAGRKAGEIFKRVRAGEDFAALASEYSEDSYKEKGGDLGYIGRGGLEPGIEKAAFGLAIGESMGPIETEYGFYIIKVEDKKPESQLSFDEVKERIRKVLEAKAKEERKTEWMNSLRGKAKIEYR